MQVTQVTAEGLKREYKVVVPATDIAGEVDKRLQRLSRTIRLPGFRPGKAPVALLRKQYGRSIMGEVLESVVNEGQQKAIADNELKPALRPKVEIDSFEEGKDLAFSMAVEVMPDVPKVDYGEISLTRLRAEVDEATVDRAAENIANAHRDYQPLSEPRPARTDDRVIIDFEGTLDGEPFEGGKAEGFPLVLGSGAMVSGFEAAIEGLEAGAETTFDIDMPEDYRNTDLAGKTVQFKVKVREIGAAKSVKVDDAFAQEVGFEDLAALRKTLRDRIASNYEQASRARVKRALLDRLAETYAFQVPEGMVDLEFEGIWKQVEAEKERDADSFEGKDEQALRDEYRAIAERRVRLGLLLAEVGNANDIKVEPQDLQHGVMEQARQHPGQEKEVIEFFQNNQAAVEQLRAPIFEDKVVDFILQLAKVETKAVPVEELMRDPDEENEEGTAEGETKTASET